MVKNLKQKEEAWPPLTVAFQSLHFDRDWDVSDGSSLWTIFILNNIVETLIRVDNDSNIKPGLSLGQFYSEDKKTIRFSITDKFKFHNGETITPEDILHSLKRSLSSDRVKHSEIAKSLASPNLEESLVLNGNDIEIRLKEPLNAFIYKLSIPEMGIVPQDYAKEKTPKESLNNLSGPYKVIGFTAKKLSLEKHAGHPLLDEKSPDRVDIIEIPEMEKGIEYYRENDNVMLVGSGYEKITKYMELEGQKHISASALTEFFLPNLKSPRLNTEEKRREVFSLIKMAFETIPIDERVAERTNQIFTINNLSRLEDSQLEGLYDNKTSKKSLKLSVILFDFIRENPIPFLIQEQLKPYGIELEFITGSNDELINRMKNSDYDFAYYYSGVSALDPIVELIYLLSHPFLKIVPSKAIAEALEKAKVETDREKYMALLKEIHWKILSEYRTLPLMHTRMVYCAKGKYQLKDLSRFDGGFNLWDWHKQ